MLNLQVKALSQRSVSHQCCYSQKRGILLFSPFYSHLASAGFKLEEETLAQVRGLPPWLRPSRTSRDWSQTDSMKSKVTWKLPYWRNISYLSAAPPSPFPSQTLVIHFSHASQSVILSVAGGIVLEGTLKHEIPLVPNGVLSSLACTLIVYSTIFLSTLLRFPVFLCNHHTINNGLVCDSSTSIACFKKIYRSVYSSCSQLCVENR
ncbi:hypothetical protein PAMP_014922 [Pampus punctatissimus]